MTKNEILIVLETKIHEVFSVIQTRGNIEIGDILPSDAIELDALTGALADLIEKITRYQMEEKQ